jgi:hypothetical protein
MILPETMLGAHRRAARTTTAIALCLCPSASAFHSPAVWLREAARGALGTAAICSTIFHSDPACATEFLKADVAAASQNLNQAAVRYAKAAAPIAQSLSADTFGPFASQTSKVLASADQAEVQAAAEALQRVFASLPPERARAAADAWKGAVSGESPQCSRIPLQTAVQPLVDQPSLAPLLKHLPAGGVCAPSVDALERLALSQAEALSAADPNLILAFNKQAAAALKSAPKGLVFQLVPDSRQLADGVPAADRFRVKEGFRTARKELEAATTELVDLRQREAKGPPKCYTIGCNVNYESGLWKDDVVTLRTLSERPGMLIPELEVLSSGIKEKNLGRSAP